MTSERANSRKTDRCIDLESSLLILSKTEIQFDLNLSARIAGVLICAGEGGIPIFRVSETLWPDQLFSFRHNLKRMEQLILRARREYGFEMNWKELHLTAASNPEWSCLWSRIPRPKGWSFVRDHREFTRAEVERHFGVSKRWAVKICEYWIQENLITPTGNSRQKKYLRTDPRTDS